MVIENSFLAFPVGCNLKLSLTDSSTPEPAHDESLILPVLDSPTIYHALVSSAASFDLKLPYKVVVSVKISCASSFLLASINVGVANHHINSMFSTS